MKRLLLTTAVFLIILGCADTKPPQYSAVPGFKMMERSNKAVSLEDLKGKVWVADFIFTRCAGICLSMSSNMQKLQDRLPKEVLLVSFSVDPTNDTPQVLSEYARRYDADPNRWMFLTGDPQSIQDLSIGGFKLALDPTGGTENEPITHSSRFVLVDREGVIRGYYGMEDATSLDRIAADVNELL